VRAAVLDRELKAYRIDTADNKYRIFDGYGSVLYPGQWNTEACRVIYCSEHYSTALLEKLVHSNIGKIPSGQQWIEISIPTGTSYEVVTPYSLRGWDNLSQKTSKRFGDRWVKEQRSAILIVPSIVARVDNNILINEAHPEFKHLTTSLNQPVIWDSRLFKAK
jgi:RES domain-containing protein